MVRDSAQAGARIVLVGNKCDNALERQVSTERGQAFAAANGARICSRSWLASRHGSHRDVRQSFYSSSAAPSLENRSMTCCCCCSQDTALPNVRRQPRVCCFIKRMLIDLNSARCWSMESRHRAPEPIKQLVMTLALIRSLCDTPLSALPNELLFLILENLVIQPEGPPIDRSFLRGNYLSKPSPPEDPPPARCLLM